MGTDGKKSKGASEHDGFVQQRCQGQGSTKDDTEPLPIAPGETGGSKRVPAGFGELLEEPVETEPLPPGDAGANVGAPKGFSERFEKSLETEPIAESSEEPGTTAGSTTSPTPRDRAASFGDDEDLSEADKIELATRWFLKEYVLPEERLAFDSEVQRYLDPHEEIVDDIEGILGNDFPHFSDAVLKAATKIIEAKSMVWIPREAPEEPA
jgi:hypothetical protein